MKPHVKKLRAMDACEEAVKFAAKYPTMKAAWLACERADWLLWFAGRLSGKPGGERRKPLVLAACACARMALKLVPKGEKRSLKAIQTAEAWANGKPGVTLDDVRNAYASASASAYAASAASAYAASSAYASTYAASSAYASTYAASSAYAAKYKTMKKMAAIVRRFYPIPPKGGAK